MKKSYKLELIFFIKYPEKYYKTSQTLKNMIKTQAQTTFKDFQLLSRLGEGSYSSVFKVKRLSDNTIYAFKRVKMDLLNDKEKENALNEVRILASITDPYIIGYKEAFFDENTNSLCIVMEYADGGDLQKLIKTSQETCKYIPEREIWQCLLHIAKGLKTLHEMHILHRDLKCANVFVSGDNVYKLGDMNVSKVAAKGLVYTQTGTPYYASPEVWRDEAYDMKSDIWSLGCVLYEMTSQKPPFRANDMQGLFKKVQKGVFERIPKVYSDDLFNMICEFLKVQPSLRPSSQQILNHPIVLKNTRDGKQDILRENSKAKLLGTIELPQNLKFLKERLPRPNYNLDKLNNSFEKEKSSADVKKPVVIRGESAGGKRLEKNKYISKESIFQDEIQLKLDNINKKLEEQEKAKKPDTPKMEENKRNGYSRNNSKVFEKKISRPPSRNKEENYAMEKKQPSRPASRNSKENEKKLNILHSPLPEINIRNNNSKINVKIEKNSGEEIRPLMSPKNIPLENVKQVNEFMVNYKSPSNNIPKINIIEKPANIILRPNSRDSGVGVRKIQRPYSHAIPKRNEETSKEQVKPQIRMNARPLTKNMNINKNLRPFSGVERDRPELVQKNAYINKDMVTKKKNVISLGHLHTNKTNKIVGDSLDLLKNEIEEKMQKPSFAPEIGVVIKNKVPQRNDKNSGVARVYSGKTKVEIIRKNSKNIDEDYNVNVFRNKLNLQEKPVTAPNVSRGQYKIMSKEKREGNYRVAVGQQVLNNNYKIYVKEQNNFH